MFEIVDEYLGHIRRKHGGEQWGLDVRERDEASVDTWSEGGRGWTPCFTKQQNNIMNIFVGMLIFGFQPVNIVLKHLGQTSYLK